MKRLGPAPTTCKSRFYIPRAPAASLRNFASLRHDCGTRGRGQPFQRCQPINMPAYPFPTLTADEAAAMINDGALVGFSGFSPAGAAKAVPRALAARARQMHARGQRMSIR